MPDIILDNGDAVLTAGWFFAGSGTQWFGGVSVSSTPSDIATYSFPGLTQYQTYGVYASWAAAVNRTTVAQCTVKGATGATLASVNYNQQIAPSGVIRNDTARDVIFQLLATIAADGTTGTVVLGFPTESSGNLMIADAVMFSPLSVPPAVTLGAVAGPASASLFIHSQAPPLSATLAAQADPATITWTIDSGSTGPLVIGEYYTIAAADPVADPWGVDPDETSLLN